MSIEEQQYLDLLRELVEVSDTEPLNNDRTGVGTWSVFGRELRFDLSKGFPLITTKRMGLKSILGELLWFISGSTNASELEQKYGCTIWREWKDENGELGEVYGHQWRNFGGKRVDTTPIPLTIKGFDQLKWLINEIKTNPNSRRLYVTSANPLSRYNQALDCCHNYFQVQVKDGKLNLYFQMRSNDVFLGLPYNIASYALLAIMLAIETGYGVGELVYFGVDVHLYSNHLEQVKEQLSRTPYDFPKLIVTKKSFFEYTLDDFKLVDYNYHPTIKAEVAI